MAHPTWPLYDVVVRTSRIELRLPSEAEYIALLEHSNERIYERNGFNPFGVDWVGRPAESMRWLWKNRAEWEPDKWHFGSAVFIDGEIVGAQEIFATAFGLVRSVSTGSWLIPAAQGQGFGKEARVAALHLAFAGLGALEAHSCAHVDNAASNGVSRALGYEFTYRANAGFGSRRAEMQHLLLRRSTWETHPAHQRDDIAIDGLEPVLDWFIAPGAETPDSPER